MSTTDFDPPIIRVNVKGTKTNRSFDIELDLPEDWLTEEERTPTRKVTFNSKNAVSDVMRLYECQAIFDEYHAKYAPNVLKSAGDWIDLGFQRLVTVQKTKTNLTPIVIILESPHKSEYKSNFSPRGPAMGTTGANIGSLIESCEEEHPLQLNPIIICNPIPWQCSLVQLHSRPMGTGGRYVANTVWRRLWRNETHDAFYNRVYDMHPKLVLNCCTQSLTAADNNEKTLKHLVSDFLKSRFPKVQVLPLGHPSYWTRTSFASTREKIQHHWAIANGR